MPSRLTEATGRSGRTRVRAPPENSNARQEEAGIFIKIKPYGEAEREPFEAFIGRDEFAVEDLIKLLEQLEVRHEFEKQEEAEAEPDPAKTERRLWLQRKGVRVMYFFPAGAYRKK